MAPSLMPGAGPMPAVDDAVVAELRSELRGELLQPGDAGYDEARTIWNAMIDGTRRSSCGGRLRRT